MSTVQAQFFQSFWTALFTKKIDLNSDTFRAVLHTTAPNFATDDAYADLAGELSTGGGYTSGGYTISLSTSLVGGLPRITLVSATLTASGSVGPFRYVTVYSDTSAGNSLVCTFDTGGSNTMAASDVFTIPSHDLWQYVAT